MWIALAYLLLAINIAAHEFAHGIMMVRYGVEIESAGLFFGPGPKIKTKWLPVPVKIGIIPLGAYVKPTAEGTRVMREELPTWKAARIAAAGVIVNALASIVLLAPVIYMAGQRGILADLPVAFWVIIGVVAVVGVLGVFFPRFTSTVLIPIVGLGIVAYLVSILAPAFAADPIHAATHGGAAPGVDTGAGEGQPAFGGPVLIVQIIQLINSPFMALYVGGMLANALALFNMLPIAPIDGGHIIFSHMRDWFGLKAANVYWGLSAILGIGLVLMILIGDITVRLLGGG